MTVNVKNDFYQSSMDELCEKLEAGEKVHIYVDCIGHTRAAWVEEAYVKELEKKYGEDRLKTEGTLWDKVYYLA